MRRVIPVVILIIALTLVGWAAAGCGEGDDTSQSSMPGLGGQEGDGTTPSLDAGMISGVVEALLKFADVLTSDPYFEQITELAERGIIDGFEDGTFRPDSPVTRQQFAKMIVKTMGYPVSEADICPFVDVPESTNPLEPLYPDHYVAVCAARGITEGKTPTEFAPNENIIRAQLITMVVRAADLDEPPEDYSPPFDKFDQTHYPFARQAAYAGLLSGLQGMGTDYNFYAAATRGEVSVLLYNLLQK